MYIPTWRDLKLYYGAAKIKAFADKSVSLDFCGSFFSALCLIGLAHCCRLFKRIKTFVADGEVKFSSGESASGRTKAFADDKFNGGSF